MSTARLWPLCTNVARRLRSYALGILALVMLGWAFIMYEAGGPAILSILEVRDVVEWNSETESGAILHITATTTDAAANNMTLREWVDQLMEWFPPRVD